MEPVNETVQLHTLCETCQNLCRDSKLLNDPLAWERSPERYGDPNGTSTSVNFDLTSYFGEFTLGFYAPEDRDRIKQLIERYPTRFFEVTLPRLRLTRSDVRDDEHNSREPETNASRSDQPRGDSHETGPGLHCDGMHIFFERPSLRQTTVHDLEESALQGCHLCSLLIPRHPHSQEQLDPKTKITSGFGLWYPVGRIQLILVSEAATFSVIRIREIKEDSIFVDNVDEKPNFEFDRNLIPARDSVSTSSEATFAWIQEKLSECIGKHKQCDSLLEPSGNPPTRLLDLGPPTGVQEPRLHICDYQKDRGIQYVALSHCWGNADILKLEKATLTSLIATVPFQSLPRTFQDAIHICRRLGYRYLWVDSLCIIQDDHDDWKHEAGIMACVYSNCVFSLAALHGANSASGCYTSRDPRSYLPCKLPVARGLYGVRFGRNPKKNEWKIGGGGPLEGFTPAYLPWEDDRVSKAPLLDRGWVFQERIVSPRTIYFGAQGVNWECRTLQTNDGHCIFSDQVPRNGKEFFDLLLSAQQSQEYHKKDLSEQDHRPFTECDQTKRRIASNQKSLSTGQSIIDIIISITQSQEYHKDPRPTTECDQTNQKVASNADSLSTRQSNLNTEKGKTPATKPSEIDSPEPIRTTEENFENLELDWSRIVGNYSTKGFTDHGDKLIALQGLIDLIAAHNGHLTPYFGMWKELLFGELLWEVVQPGRRLEKYIAPSFSWASIESPIRRLYEGKYEDSARSCSILAATTVDSSLNGAPRRGVITMSGKYVCLHIPGNTASFKMLVDDSSGAKQRIYSTTIKLDSRADFKQELIHMHFLVMVRLKQDIYRRCAQGLILRPTTMPDSEHGQTHERIGAFHCTYPTEDIPWLDDVEETTGAPYFPERVLNII